MKGEPQPKRQRLGEKSTAEVAAKEHISKLRKDKFGIGALELNPLTLDLHHAVTCLSAELYTKDVHFIMELIQNAEDNNYEEFVEPTLEFLLTTKDITGYGAPETLLVFNNEVGFSRQNMESICSVGRSTKKGKRNKGFIGEKGIGFKSVFLVSEQPHVVSNGYKVKFCEKPDKDCGIGYIIPEWISDNSLVAKVQEVYGSLILPMTTIILPLKADKVNPVKKELSGLHPELLLFLSKLRRLFVRENSCDPISSNSVTAISIASETNLVVARDKQADSRVVHLSVKEKPDAPEEQCQYYIWRQAFPVKPEAKISGRSDVEMWTVSLAFPYGERLMRGTSSVGIFSFLPTSMVTNFPFVIQADFILSSSRETILLDSKWNQGILECVPFAFVNAFTSCVKEKLPFSRAEAFQFLPVHASSFPELNKVRETIRRNLVDALIIPCETFCRERIYCKPTSAVRIHPSFWEILFKLKKAGVSLVGISKMEDSLVCFTLDKDRYVPSLEFLGVSMRINWCQKCIAACNLASQAPDEIYIDILSFVLVHSKKNFYIGDMPLIKFVDETGNAKLCSVSRIKGGHKVQYAEKSELHAWLHKCNMQLGFHKKIYFFPDSTQKVLMKHPSRYTVSYWLRYYGVKSCSAVEYASQISDCVSVTGDKNAAVTFCHFLYHSKLKNFLTDSDIYSLVKSMPIVDGTGCVRVTRTETLVPATGSKWAKLLGSVNPFLQVGYVDIGEAYAASCQFVGEHTPDKMLLNFLTVHSKARDLPDILPPNLALKAASSHLTGEQAFFLLDWIRIHRTRGSNIPQQFIESIRCGKWLRMKSGVDCPSNCIIPNESGLVILDMLKNVPSGFSIIDESFYGFKISSYGDELKFLGVQCGINGIQNIVMHHFELLVSCTLSRETAFSLFLFTGFLKERKMLDETWVTTMGEGRWMKTCRGSAAPKDSVVFLSDSDAEAASVVTSLNVIDYKFYGGKLHSFAEELKLFGVKFDSEAYVLATKCFSFPDNTLSRTSDSAFFILNCLRNTKSLATSFVEKVQGTPWLKTNVGFKCPSATILYESDWACLLKIVNVPIIDEVFYGDEIKAYLDELKAVGVAVEFGDVLKIVVNELKSHLPSPASGHLIKLLHCIKNMRKTMHLQLGFMCDCLSREEIIKTRHGYKKPGQSILFSSKWASISQFVDLPVIDDSFYGIKIYGLREELKMLGVLSSMEEGALYVARGLSGRIEKELLTAESTISLLDCLKVFMVEENDTACLDVFLENIITSELLMTSHGYKLPKDAVLFKSDWKEMLELTDAPFIDDKFYGMDMSNYICQLKVIGVKIEPLELCSVLWLSLPLLSDTLAIKRIYSFLNEFKWKPDSLASGLHVWIPSKESSEGQWIDPIKCVLHDKDHYFAPILYSLDTYYEKELLPFFGTAFGVIEFPSTSHFFQIWSLWESRENCQLFEDECCFFWGYVLKNWNSEKDYILKQKLAKVPAISSDGGIRLVPKENVFVSDDLWLKKMFMDFGDSSLFVWFPKSNASSAVCPVKLFEVYCTLGVRKISESVKCTVTIVQSFDRPDKADLKQKLIVKGLLKIMLGFLACKIHTPLFERHEAAKSLLNVSVFEDDENVRVSYKLLLNAKEHVEREAVKLVHWDKKSKRLFVHGAFSENQKSAKFATFFAQEIAEGMLPQERSARVNDLRNLIQMGFLLEFQEQSVDFLLTRDNIEVLTEDEEFLAVAFPVDGSHKSVLAKRVSQREQLSPSTPGLQASQRTKRRRFNTLADARKEGESKGKSKQVKCSVLSEQKVPTKRGTIKDSSKRRKPSAFFIFLEEFRKQYKLKHPVCSVVAVGRAAGEVWREMSHLEKAPYIEMAEKRVAEYKDNSKLVGGERPRVKDEARSDASDEEHGA